MLQSNDMRCLQFTRAEAAQRLGISISSLDVLIARGILRSRRMGSRRLIPAASVAALALTNLSRMWPAKVNGKTTRRPEKSDLQKLA